MTEPIAAPDSRVSTVLVMDANDSVHRLIQLLLQLNGYHVLSAGDPDDALRILRDRDSSVAVVVMDPSSEGAGRVIVEATGLPRPPQLVVTGLPPPPFESDVQPNIWRLRKPFTPADLLRAVGEALRAFGASA